MNLGDRIKRYEKVSGHHLLPRSPVIIRIDGKSFHTYTRGMKKPFDMNLIDAMVVAGEKTAKEMMGFKLGYHQSDEFTLLLTDYDTLETESWFDYKLQKLASVSASLFTAHFNKLIGNDNLAFFDSRAFNCPVDDIPNVFIWRQRDWERNSLQMYCRSFFSHKELINKNKQNMHDMLHSIDKNWSDLLPQLKNGTFVTKDGGYIHEKLNYLAIQGLIQKSTNNEV